MRRMAPGPVFPRELALLPLRERPAAGACGAAGCCIEAAGAAAAGAAGAGACGWAGASGVSELEHASANNSIAASAGIIQLVCRMNVLPAVGTLYNGSSIYLGSLESNPTTRSSGPLTLSVDEIICLNIFSVNKRNAERIPSPSTEEGRLEPAPHSDMGVSAISFTRHKRTQSRTEN